MSGRPELAGEARSRLRMAQEWLRNWSRLTQEERKKEKISDEDIVELTLAHINIHGPADGAHSLGRWRPRQVSFKVGRTVARRLIDHCRFQDVEDFARAAGNNLCLVLAITVELREILRAPPDDVTLEAFRLVQNPRVKLKDAHVWDDRASSLNSVTALVEAALQQGVCTVDMAAAVLSQYLPGEPPRALSSKFTKARLPMLRAYCLRAALQGQVLELRDLAHSELREEMDKKNQHSSSRDLLEFQEDIGVLLPWHQLWAAALLGQVTKVSLDDALNRTHEVSSSASKLYYRDNLHTLNQIALLWLDILHKLDAADTSTMSDFSQWKDELKRPLFTSTLTALARLCGQKEVTKAAALGFALDAFKLIKDERSDADYKSEGYIDAARAILTVSKPDARAFFNEAIEVASKIGDENVSRWNGIVDLADCAAQTDRPSPEIAYHFARCAELTYDYVARDKHFDWHATIEALCGLCPSSALTILSRWRDRGFGWSERILPIAVDRLISDGSLDARDALPLIGFRSQWTYDRLLDNVLARCATQEEKQAATNHLYRYMQFDGGNLSKLKEVTSRHGITVTCLDEVIAFEEKKNSSRKPGNSHIDKTDETLSSPARNWDDVFTTCNLTTADSLSRAYAAFKNTEPPWHSDQFFKEAIRRISIGSEANFIEAMQNTPEFDLFQFRAFLEQVPKAWKARPAITHALAATIKVFCSRFCMRITINRYYEIMPLKAACDLAGISEADIVGVVLDAIGEISNLLDSNRLFSLIGLLTIKLSKEEALEALKYGLYLFTPVLEDRDGDGPWSNKLLPPTDIKASLAGYIWASMAAPESVLRWEGSHTVLGLAVLGRHDVLGHLVKLAIEKKGGPFVDEKLPFYSLHALQWFLIGIARAAIEFPTVLAPFASQIVNWALKDQPHVLIRQFAARAALALANHGMFADQENLKNSLGCVNVAQLPVVKSNSYDQIRPKNKEKSIDDRIYFGIDIGPYWYAPLGRVFALPQDEIETKALKVIRTNFGFTAKGRWDEDERNRRKLYEENHTRHSHGSYPRADTLHFYHAYHAMMIVAGNLLTNTPMHRDSEYGEEDSFSEWLDRHNLTRKDGRWLWDRRDPTPLEHPAWQDRKNHDDMWRIITKDDFDESLHTENMLNVWGYWTAADTEHEQDTYISSALVSPDKSLALLRALATAKDVHDYAIPSAEGDKEIDESGFKLKGWIVNHGQDGGLDSRDRWSGGIRFSPPMPAPYIIDAMGLETDSDFRLWRGREKSVVMMSQVWGHYDEARNHESTNPEGGSRLQVSLEILTSILAKFNRDLIIKVQIDRRRRYQPYERGVEDDKQRIPTTARLYLLGADGRFRTL